MCLQKSTKLSKILNFRQKCHANALPSWQNTVTNDFVQIHLCPWAGTNTERLLVNIYEYM